MNAQNTQIRVTLPVQLQGFLKTKADTYGLSMAAYIRNLILNDVQDVTYPVYEISAKAKSAFEDAKKQVDQDELLPIENIDQFLNDL